jgi:protein-L-isoaspartate O-methyltransferase
MTGLTEELLFLSAFWSEAYTDRMHPRLFLLIGLLLCQPCWGQKPEYDFYREFRTVVGPKFREANPTSSEKDEVEAYAADLKAHGIDQREIERRVQLLLRSKPALEADYYNRFYLDPTTKVNRGPNAFLVEMVRNRQPGIALDYAMGEGRNSVYLAQLGWEVWGFDPADAAVRLANQRAAALGLTLHTASVSDDQFAFGTERFDLILFSWAMPLIPVDRVIASLKPGGMVVMEVAADYVGRNGMLKMFDALEIKRYEIVHEKADFYDRQEIDIVRLVAVKP